ncbi:MAG: hypothetical protein F4190_04930 [Acidimicrobiales bacterium]|nr:hypothetical protein [Acidimicrobiales bacterium]MYG87861.1 hypothetical protein [Acidimicrobiales bacterium]MYI27287.1 hypothetical protein [Acidimicrobiales bacterium]
MTASPVPTHQNLRNPADISESESETALRRIEADDPDVGMDARHVFEVLTWGEGPGMLRQARLQTWLWYELPCKYVDGAPGYMGRLASAAAALMDALGLHRYAAICRSDTTAEVHRAFDERDSEGFAALQAATRDSGIIPPDLDDFEWNRHMGPDEADARAAVEDALEAAVAAGELTVGARGWRATQKRIAARALDSDHGEQPGQSWRTALITERLARWVSQGEVMSETVAAARAQVANRVLHPVAPPSDLSAALHVPIWLLTRFGDEQPLTQAGNLRVAFVREVHADCPWRVIEPPPPYQQRHVEADDPILSALRHWLQRANALRKRHNKLRRTQAGTKMTQDATLAWQRLTQHLFPSGWDGFVVENAALVMLCSGGEIADKELDAQVAAMAVECGWHAWHEGEHVAPSAHAVSWAFGETLRLWNTCGFLVSTGEWTDRQHSLTEAGTAAILTRLRHTATGPSNRPF